MIRGVTVADLPRIIQLDPNRAEELTPGPATLGSALISADDCVIAYGTIKLFAELIIATNKNVSEHVRASAVKVLMQRAVEAVKDKPIDELHAFTSNDIFAQFLKEHLGFTETREKSLTFQLR